MPLLNENFRFLRDWSNVNCAYASNEFLPQEIYPYCFLMTYEKNRPVSLKKVFAFVTVGVRQRTGFCGFPLTKHYIQVMIAVCS